MLDGLINVGSVDCTRGGEAKLCEELGHSEGVVFYPAKQISKKYGKVSIFKGLK